MKLNVVFLGKCNYEKALEIQYKLVEKRQKGEIDDTLILVEHPPVITIGRGGDEANVVASEEYLNSMGIDVVRTNRGGDVTYHGDGQIVVYPIVNIKDLKMGIRDFVYNLEEIFIQLLIDKYNIEAGRYPEYTGVWIENRKIAAIGLAVKRGVTMHGVAFNVNTNLKHFQLIVPCGITGKEVTSIEKLIGSKADFDELNKLVLEYYCKIFNYDGFEELDINTL
ncbi:MAG: lipoyl(octanoyl) transferase [Clostridiales bacterium GWB2_37_7]|nr:MAG: lipoyl(octanoyl) transferase [Clostridiales bacterium GWB2_37_7]